MSLSIWIWLSGASAGVAYYLLRILRQHLLSVETGMTDLPGLGIARDSQSKIPGTAVICGGSISGLIAARVCHDHFERVVIIEPEAWLSSEEGRVVVEARTQTHARARIIQNDSIQAMLVIFVEGLRGLFSNLVEECQKSGIRLAPADWANYFWSGQVRVPHAQYSPGKLPETIWISRPATETLIRRLTLDDKAYPNITQIAGTVLGVDSETAGCITRVNIQSADDTTQGIDAAFVVDCTGPAQAGVKWLAQSGFDTPHSDDPKSFESLKEVFDPKVHYVTCRLDVTPSLAERLPIPGGLSQLKLGFFPDPHKKAPVNLFSCFAMDNRSVFICCGAWGSSNLPRTLEDIRKTVKATTLTVDIPTWFWPAFDMLEEVEDTMVCSVVRTPPSRWTHFENAPQLPSNWVALGDSVMRNNPLYAQGLAKIMLGALSLNTMLRRQSRTISADFSSQFFKMQAAKLKPQWESTKALDYGHSTTTPCKGETLQVGWFVRLFSRAVQVLATKDNQAGFIMWHSGQMIHSTSIDAFHPVFLFKVVCYSLGLL